LSVLLIKGLLQQSYLQQTLQTLAGQGITLPQVAMAAQQLQHLQDSHQSLISNPTQQSPEPLQLSAQSLSNQNQLSSGLVLSKPNPINSIISNSNQFNQSSKTSVNQHRNSSPLTSSNHQNINYCSSSSSAVPVCQKLSPTINRKEETRDDVTIKSKLLNSTNSSSLTNITEDKVTNQANSFTIRNRQEPSPEEMTDLEELEQFAKMFKQRRIKLGKLYIIHLHLVTSCHSRLLFFVY